MTKRILFIGACLLALSSCGTIDSLYSWYDYEDTTYQYSKKSTEELQAKVLEQYQKIIEQQRGSRGVVPPGLYAEYGYMLYRTGKKEEITWQKQKEKRMENTCHNNDYSNSSPFRICNLQRKD